MTLWVACVERLGKVVGSYPYLHKHGLLSFWAHALPMTSVLCLCYNLGITC